jgi:hypothetical protein
MLFHLFIVKFILVSSSFLFTQHGCFSSEEARLVVAVDDFDFKIINVAFETNVFNRYGTFDQITNRSMEDPSYVDLHCDLLDMATLTTITLKVK